MFPTVLITGADSQLAKALLRTQCVAKARRLIPLSRAQLDICDPVALARAFNQYQPDWVINCAAYNAVDSAEHEPRLALEVNALGPGYLAQQCAQHCTRLVHISTDYVFAGMGGADVCAPSALAASTAGATAAFDAMSLDAMALDLAPSALIPYRETDLASPLSVYGQSKLAGEQAVFEHLGEGAIVVRTAWLYGVDGHNFVNTMLRLMQTQGRLELIADQWGSPTWSDALARVIWQLLSHQSHGLFHYAARGHCSWYEFASEIQCQSIALGILPALQSHPCELKPCSAREYAERALMEGKVVAPRPRYSALCADKLRLTVAPPLLAADETLTAIEWQDWRQQLSAMLKQRLARTG